MMSDLSQNPSQIASAFETGAVSHVGRIRSANEDNLVVRPEFGIWAVADGMGGHENGALASATVAAAIESIGKTQSAPDLLARLEHGVLDANATLRRHIAEGNGAAMGSTLAVLLVHERHFACVWCGDSRIYLIRAGQILQISRDHTEVQEMVERGVMTAAEARLSPRRHVITRAIGVHDVPELDLDSGEIEDGDVFILCSDGLTEHVAEAEILEVAEERGAQQACSALLALTLQRGARDNVTVIIVRYSRRDDRTTQWMPNRRMQETDTP
ncbi:MAG: serine/threonine protein phosphatase [Bosea sp. 12-68-7]|nr:MAG: serine/threonine protein phosphatase [Bosea sp. 12-68-7]